MAFRKYLAERAERDFDMDVLFESMSNSDLAKELGITRQGMHKKFVKLVPKFFKLLKQEMPEASSIEILAALALEMDAPIKEFYEYLGDADKKAIADEARERGIKVG